MVGTVGILKLFGYFGITLKLLRYARCEYLTLGQS